MIRTMLLQELRRMRFEEACGGWRERWLTQEEAARLPGVCERAFRSGIQSMPESGSCKGPLRACRSVAARVVGSHTGRGPLRVPVRRERCRRNRRLRGVTSPRERGRRTGFAGGAIG